MGIDIDTILSLCIPDLHVLAEDGSVFGVRGQSLACKRNRRHLEPVRGAGISMIIDLRTGDYRNDLLFACERLGMEYRHIPIDKKHTPGTEIIKRLPLLISSISHGNFYISCTQGLHRTDTALALYYLFSPDAIDPPLMYGHVISGVFRSGEIYGRAGSVYHCLTEGDKKVLGLDDAFPERFAERKRLLTAAQSALMGSTGCPAASRQV